jgi:FkbM family methyltransferase
VSLPAGAALVTSPEAEQERWLEQEREILGYVATQHILGVLRTYDINCVLDVGANRGQFGQMLRRGGYRGHIASFEPVPDALKDLRRRAEPDENWSVHAIALGREEGTTTMQTIPGQATLSSMLAPSEYGRARFPRMAEVVPQEVPVRRLDGLLDAITESIPQPRIYLKLDTQGFDLKVFQGLGERTRDIAALQSELALLKIYEGMPRMPQALEEYERAGFEVSGLFPVSREYSTTRILEYDCIFVRASALPSPDAAKS